MNESLFAHRIFIDISPRISPRIGVFPGDTPFGQKVLLDFEKGDHLKLSSITTTVHLGAHADAPSHYAPRRPQGGGVQESEVVDIADVSLSRYLGACEVLRVQSKRGQVVDLEDLPAGFVPRAPRVLMSTGSFPDPDDWNPDFCGVSPRLVRFLGERGVVLIGIDTPSIDPQDSKTLEAHAAVASCAMSILEGLVLTDVAAGLYDLIALPLKIEGADASPVRAILVGPPRP